MKDIIDNIRHMDDLGRIVIPKQIRTILNLNTAEPIEIHVENNSIILSKHSPLQKYIVTIFHKGIGNETLYIYAANYDEAFEKLFKYYLEKGNRLGYWLNKSGEPVPDFDYEAGDFENHEDWDFFITDESLIEVLAD